MRRKRRDNRFAASYVYDDAPISLARPSRVISTRTLNVIVFPIYPARRRHFRRFLSTARGIATKPVRDSRTYYRVSCCRAVRTSTAFAGTRDGQLKYNTKRTVAPPKRTEHRNLYGSAAMHSVWLPLAGAPSDLIMVPAHGPPVPRAPATRTHNVDGTGACSRTHDNRQFVS